MVILVCALFPSLGGSIGDLDLGKGVSGLLGGGSAGGGTLPRISMMSGARGMAGNGWIGLKDREAFVTRGVKLTQMFTGLLALAALLAFMALAWWREGR